MPVLPGFIGAHAQGRHHHARPRRLGLVGRDHRRRAARRGDPDLDGRGRHDDRRPAGGAGGAACCPRSASRRRPSSRTSGPRSCTPRPSSPRSRGHPGRHPEHAEPDGARARSSPSRSAAPSRRAARHRVQEGHLGRPDLAAAHADGLRLRGPRLRGLRPPPDAGRPDRDLRGLDLADRRRPRAPARDARPTWPPLGEVQVLRGMAIVSVVGRGFVRQPGLAGAHLPGPARRQRRDDLVRRVRREPLVRGRARTTPSRPCASCTREFFEKEPA